MELEDFRILYLVMLAITSFVFFILQVRLKKNKEKMWKWTAVGSEIFIVIITILLFFAVF